ncbi:sensor histidine kinase [Methanosalsum natronophilum]|uniref:sensor histidine kinase n=1 Tax=Methanosalsum natronophilum TaxID=768733 RepID=UPI002168E77F|nr:histidine kinase dimerization/phosphoacceptor domain -containing protein [Methanosalsum natronophilum]MCS3924662.1 two-component sensor histidine kinase [Methanosalsum natronophilum]
MLKEDIGKGTYPIKFNTKVFDSLENVNEPLMKYVHEHDKVTYIARFKPFFKKPENKTLELKFLDKDNEIVHMEIKGHKEQTEQFEFISDNNNIESLILLTFNDITDRKNAEDALNKSHERLKGILDHSPLLISEISLDGEYLMMNRSLSQFLGIDPDDKNGNGNENKNENENKNDTGLTFKHLLPQDVADNFMRRINNVVEAEEPITVLDSFEYENKYQIFSTTLFPLYDSYGNIRAVGSVGEDITERKRVEELERNQLLVHEIHHRVKNNLQVIISLLNLQSKLFKDNEDVVNAFRESQNRIRSMSLAHEKLYNTSNVANIVTRDYIEGLVQYISGIYGTHEAKIDIKLDIDDLSLNMDTTIPLGLIINEILTNAYKHAFNGLDEGEINVSFKKKEPGYELIITDNGIGISTSKEDVAAEHKSFSLGETIIDLLVKQLEGNITVKDNNGTFYRINF